MSKKNLPNIFVRKVPNGYVLIVDSKEYMAFNVDQLINIFFTHVAVGKTEYLDQEMSAALLTAAASYETIGDALEAVATWMAAARKAEKHEQAAIRAQANANERAERAEREREKLHDENLDLRMKVSILEKKLMGIGKQLVGDTKPKSDYNIRKRDFDDKPKKSKHTKIILEEKTV